LHKQIKAKKSLLEQPLRLIALGFVAVILCGTLLLLLPAAAQSGESCGLKVALFTAASATCVTGMTLVETAVFWSGFGQAVILLLIQIGGLGVMLTGGLVLMLLDGRISVRERMLLGQSISSDGLSDVVRMTRNILLGTLAAEGCGALILALRLRQDMGWAEALWKGVFHAVSAFCNAGFDLTGGGSLAPYRGDMLVTLTVCTLVILGGLGFYVWSDLFRVRRFCWLQAHTKVVLTATAALLVLGTVGLLGAEAHNPATLAGQSAGNMVLDAFFQSVNCRNAGFEQLPQSAFTPAGRLLSMVLMLIGGSPGSTAGGLKTTTAVVLLAAAAAALRGREDTVLFGRTVPRRTVTAAVAMLIVGLLAVAAGAMALLAFDALTLEEAVFESLAAFGTAGLSMGVTASLSTASHAVLMVLMFAGRVGVMNLGLATLLHAPRRQAMHYAEGKFIL